MAITDSWVGSLTAANQPWTTTTNWNTARNPPAGAEVAFPNSFTNVLSTIAFGAGVNSPLGITYSAVSAAQNCYIGGADRAVAGSATWALPSGAYVDVAAGSILQFSAAITGSSGFIKKGAGAYNPRNSNLAATVFSFTGGTDVQEGSLNLGGGTTALTRFGVDAITLSGANTSLGTGTGGNVGTITNVVNLNGLGAFIQQQNPGTFTFGAAVNVGSSNTTAVLKTTSTGPLVLTGPLNLGANGVTASIESTGDIRLNGVIGGTAGFAVNSTGTGNVWVENVGNTVSGTFTANGQFDAAIIGPNTTAYSLSSVDRLPNITSYVITAATAAKAGIQQSFNAALTITKNISIGANATYSTGCITIGGTAAVTFTGNISGSGSLDIRAASGGITGNYHNIAASTTLPAYLTLFANGKSGNNRTAVYNFVGDSVDVTTTQLVIDQFDSDAGTAFFTVRNLSPNQKKLTFTSGLDFNTSGISSSARTVTISAGTSPAGPTGGNIELGGILNTDAGALSVTKTGDYTLIVSAASTYKGALTVSMGAVDGTAAFSLGDTTGAGTVASTVSSGATARGVAGAFNRPLATLNIAGVGMTDFNGALVGVGAASSSSPTFKVLTLALTSSPVLYAASASDTLYIETRTSSAAPITGATGLTFTGGGTPSLSTPSAYFVIEDQGNSFTNASYTGALTLNSGVDVILTRAGLLGASASGTASNLSLANYAKLRVGSNGQTISRASQATGDYVTIGGYSGTVTFSTAPTWTTTGAKTLFLAPSYDVASSRYSSIVFSASLSDVGGGSPLAVTLEATPGSQSTTLSGATLNFTGGLTIGRNGAATASLGGTTRVLASSITMQNGSTLTNGTASVTPASLITFEGTVQHTVTSVLSGTGKTITHSGTGGAVFAPANTAKSSDIAGAMDVPASTTVVCTAEVDVSVAGNGKALGNLNVTVQNGGTIQTTAGTVQRGRMRYGGSLTFEAGATLRVGA